MTKTPEQFKEEMMERARKESPCINSACDNNGIIAVADQNGEPVPEQCEYCWRRDQLTTDIITDTAEYLREGMGEKRDVRNDHHGGYGDQSYNTYHDKMTALLDSLK